MSKLSLLLFLTFSVVCISSNPNDLLAQGRRGHDRIRVVKPHHQARLVRGRHHLVRPPHIRYTHLPRWGSVVSYRPNGAIIIASYDGPYYFHNGIFYMHRQPGFIIVRPRPGIRIKVLPAGHRRFMIRNRPYYYFYGTFYVKTARGREYEVVNAPEGAIVDALPEGYEIKKVGSTEYYVLDGVYYAEVHTDQIENGVGYQVVKI